MELETLLRTRSRRQIAFQMEVVGSRGAPVCGVKKQREREGEKYRI